VAARCDITEEQVDAAIDYTIRNGAEDRGQTVSYSRVFEAAGLPPPQELHQGGDSQIVTAVMERFHFRCRARELPPLDALVVHVAGAREGKPGGGYFRVNGFKDPFGERATAEQVMAAYAFWEEQVRDCRRWGDDHRRRRS
jgi:hypothetical protein